MFLCGVRPVRARSRQNGRLERHDLVRPDRLRDRCERGGVSEWVTKKQKIKIRRDKKKSVRMLMGERSRRPTVFIRYVRLFFFLFFFFVDFLDRYE